MTFAISLYMGMSIPNNSLRYEIQFMHSQFNQTTNYFNYRHLISLYLLLLPSFVQLLWVQKPRAIITFLHNNKTSSSHHILVFLPNICGVQRKLCIIYNKYLSTIETVDVLQMQSWANLNITAVSQAPAQLCACPAVL